MANEDEQFHKAGLYKVGRKEMVASDRTAHSFNVKAVKCMQAGVSISVNLTPELHRLWYLVSHAQ